MSKMLVEQLIQDLQNLTKQRITQKDLGDALGISKQAIGNKKADNYEFAEYEINKIKDYVISKYSDNKCTLVDNSDSVTIDYYPDVFGSCGNGVFELSPEKTQIIKDYKQSKANNKAMLEAAKQNQNNLEYARQHAWKVPDGFFESVRNQIQKSPIPEQIRG